MSKYLARGSLLSASVVLISLSLHTLAADQAAKGNLWETTSQMSMDGMPMQMPANKRQVCTKKDQSEPPGNAQRNCTNTSYQRVGNKVTWHVQCTGPAMTGMGQIVYSGTDSYAGFIKFISEQGNMTINLTGKKVGECDHPQ
jgi:hypothetical protein